MCVEQENIFYYITVMNENYPQPPLSERKGVKEGILRGMYLLQEGNPKVKIKLQLLGSGTILREVLAAAKLLQAKKVRLATEGEFSQRFPDCLVGAMPPFGNLYDLPVYVDSGLTEQPEIVFRVGTHRHTMKIAYADFSRLARPALGEFSM